VRLAALEPAVPERLWAQPFDRSPSRRALGLRAERPAARLWVTVGQRQALGLARGPVAARLQPVAGLRRAVRARP